MQCSELFQIYIFAHLLITFLSWILRNGMDKFLEMDRDYADLKVWYVLWNCFLENFDQL